MSPYQSLAEALRYPRAPRLLPDLEHRAVHEVVGLIRLRHRAVGVEGPAQRVTSRGAGRNDDGELDRLALVRLDRDGLRDGGERQTPRVIGRGGQQRDRDG